MTQEKPPRWGKLVLLRGQLLLLIFKLLGIAFVAENKINNRDNLSLFSQHRTFLETVPINLLEIWAKLTKKFHTLYGSILYGQHCTNLDFCAHYTDLYGFNKCCTIALISVQISPRFLCTKSVLYGLVMTVINVGICINFCAHLCMEICATLFWKWSSSCSRFSECLCVCFLNGLMRDNSQWTHERHLMVSFPSWPSIFPKWLLGVHMIWWLIMN